MTMNKRVMAGVLGACGFVVAGALLFPAKDAAAGSKCPNIDEAANATSKALGHAGQIAGGHDGQKQAVIDDLTKALGRLQNMQASPICR